MDNQKELFESMPVPKALATLAIPMIISQIVIMFYNLADTYFIGSTNDSYKIAAVSLNFALYLLVNAMGNLFGIGGGGLISRLLGRNRPEDAKRVCAFSIYATVLLALAYSLICWICMEPLLRLLGASDNTIDYASSYCLWVIVIGGLPSTMGITLSHLMRSQGYSREASICLGLGGLLNVALDPLFMFVLLPKGQEVTGAALATMTANVISLLYSVLILWRLRSKTVLSISPKMAVAAKPYAAEVVATGFPSALGSFLSSLCNTTTNRLASAYGDIPIAAIGIVKKIDMLPLNVGLGLSQGATPLIAYNFSSGNHKRMRSVESFSRLLGMGFAALCIVTFQLTAPGLIGSFIDDPETIALGTRFLRICCLATPLMICNFQMTYTFQAMGMAKPSLLLSVCRQGLICIPLMFLMNHLFGLYGLVYTQLLSDSITMVLSLSLYRLVLRKTAVVY